MVSEGIIGVMARVGAAAGRRDDAHGVDVEPIALNAARQLRNYAVRNNIKSVMVVAPAFRSRRSLLVYQSVLGPSGVTLKCVPVFGLTTSETWAKSWHGIQGVAEQFFKLQYYRLYVLPFLSWSDSPQGINAGVTCAPPPWRSGEVADA